jgi:tetratricopeptide (TPR) repeat protein
MFSRLFVYSFLFIIAGVSYYIYTYNPSYQKSIQAKVLYVMGEYEEANELAKEAYKLDHYNRMSFTILTQSQNNLKYVKYIEDATKFYTKIDKITDKSTLSREDKTRIAMMCRVVIDDYEDVIKYKTTFTDDDLIQNATELKERFEIILESVEQKGHR